MADYAKAASEFKARLDAKAKKRRDLYAFFEDLKTSLGTEVALANAELAAAGAPAVVLQQASEGEPTIDLVCGKAFCRISQDRSTPSIGGTVVGEAGESTITFLILTEESPLKASRVSLTPELEAKVGPAEIAATLVEALIAGAP